MSVAVCLPAWTPAMRAVTAISRAISGVRRPAQASLTATDEHTVARRGVAPLAEISTICPSAFSLRCEKSAMTPPLSAVGGFDGAIKPTALLLGQTVEAIARLGQREGTLLFDPSHH